MIDLLEHFNKELQETEEPNQISRVIYKFQTKLKPFLFSKLDDESIVNNFDCVWRIFFQCTANKSVSVRNATYSAVSYFLTSFIIFYPKQLINSFIKIVNEPKLESSDLSLLLISLFAFITNFICPLKLQKFLDLTPIFHHFMLKNSKFIEHFANIVSNLSDLGIEWFDTLLSSYLSQNVDSLYLIQSICEIVRKNPRKLMENVLLAVKDKKCFISIISYLLINIEPLKSLNYFNIGKIAFNILKSKESSLLEINEALQIFAYSKDSFDLKISFIDDNIIKMKFDNDFVELKFDNNLSSIYLLDLPLKYLIPNDNDSLTIFTTKFKNIGKRFSDSNKIVDVDGIIDLIDSYTKTKYSDKVSACLQCLSLCVNTLILNSKNCKIIKVLQRLIYETPVSWFHAYDILSVIGSIKIELIPLVLDFEKTLKIIIEFSMISNQKLLDKIYDVIVNLTTKENFVYITKFVASDTDFFEKENLLYHINILIKIIEANKNENKNHLFGYLNSIIEVTSYYIYNLNVLSSIFKFLSLFDLSNIDEILVKPLYKIALQIICSGLDIIYGYPKIDKKDEIEEKIYENVHKYYVNNCIDIISKDVHKFKKTFSFMYLTLSFLLSSSKIENNILKLCEKMFSFFPKECTLFLKRRRNEINNNIFRSTLKNIYHQIDNVKSIKVHSIWCILAIHSKVPPIIDYMKTDAEYFLSNYEGVKIKYMINFISFLLEFSDSYDNKINHYFQSLDEKEKIEFLGILKEKHGITFGDFNYINPKQDYEYIKEFSNLLDFQKQNFISSLVFRKCNGLTEEILNYAKKILSGFKLQLFLVNQSIISEDFSNYIFISYFNKSNDIYKLSPQKRLEYYIDINSVKDVKKLLMIHNNLIIPDNLNISKECFPIILNYLKINNLTKEYKIIFSKSNYFNIVERLINSKEKIKKSEILEISKLIENNYIKFDNVFELLLKLINVDDDISSGRISAILFLIGTSMINNVNIPNNFYISFFSFLEKNIQNIPTHFLCYILKHLQNYKLSQENTQLIEKIMHYVSSNFSIYYIYHEYLLINKINIIKINDLPQNCLIPSLFNNFLRCLKLLKTFNLIKSNYSQIIGSYSKFQNNPEVDECFSLFISDILKSKTYQQLIFSQTNIKNFIINSNLPSFIPFSNILFHLMESASFDILSIIEIQIDLLICVPNSLDIFKTFFILFESKLMRITNYDEKEEILLARIEIWLDSFKEYDSYYLLEYLQFWIKLMRQFLPLQKMIDTLINSFLSRLRFLQVFVAITQVVFYIRSFASAKEKQIIENSLQKGKNTLTNENQKHAFDLLINENVTKQEILEYLKTKNL